MRLNQQRDLYRDRLAFLWGAINDFEAHLTSPKFAGPDPFDKYINRDDVLRWIEQNFRPILSGELDYLIENLDEKSMLSDASLDSIAPCNDFTARRLMVTIP